MRKEFKVHMLNEDGKKKATLIAQGFAILADLIQSIVGEGSPELTLAFRDLERACFYAKKSMAQQEKNQQL